MTKHVKLAALAASALVTAMAVAHLTMSQRVDDEARDGQQSSKEPTTGAASSEAKGGYAGYGRDFKYPDDAARREALRAANRWRLEARKQGDEAYRRGDDAEAERLFRHAGMGYSSQDLGDLLVMQGRYAEALEVVAPRLDRGEDPKWVNPVIAVCYYGLGDRRKGDAAAPKVVVNCGAYYDDSSAPGYSKYPIDETPNKTPIDSSAKMEAAAWHAIAFDRAGSRMGLYAAEKAALAFPDVPAFSFTYAQALCYSGFRDESGLQNGPIYQQDAIAWYRRCLRTAKGALREDLETWIYQTEMMQANPNLRERFARRNP